MQHFGDHADADKPNADRLLSRDLTDRLHAELLDRLAGADGDELLVARDLPRLLGAMYHDGGDRGQAALCALSERADGMEKLLIVFRDGDPDRPHWTRLADLLGEEFADRALAAAKDSETVDEADIEGFLARRTQTASDGT